MQISSTRIFELLEIVAGYPSGVTVAEFKAAALPRSRDERGARRLLGELVRRDLLETRGPRFALSPRGLEMHQTKAEPSVELGTELIEEQAELDELTQFAIEAGELPPPPRPGDWQQGADGQWFSRRGNYYWITPGGSEPPRMKKHDRIYIFDGVCVRVERLDFGPAPHPSQPAMPPPGWYPTSHGARFWDGQAWQPAPQPNGAALAQPQAQPMPLPGWYPTSHGGVKYWDGAGWR